MDDSDATSSPIIQRYNYSFALSESDSNGPSLQCRKLFNISNETGSTNESNNRLSESLINAFEADEPSMPEDDKVCIDLFQTARGKSIYVPINAMEKSHQIVTNLDHAPQQSHARLKSIKPSNITRVVNYGSKANVSTVDSEFTQPITFTQLADSTSSKEITNSSKSKLVSFETICDANSFSKKLNESKSDFGGFSTGAGQSVVVSKEAKDKFKNTFDDQSFEKPSFSGFTTGKGNTVNISAEALNQARGVIDNSGIKPYNKKRVVNYGSKGNVSSVDSEFTQPITFTQLDPSSKQITNCSKAKLESFETMCDAMDANNPVENLHDVETTFFQTGRHVNTDSGFIKISKESMTKGLSALSDFENCKNKKVGAKTPKNKKFNAPRKKNDDSIDAAALIDSAKQSLSKLLDDKSHFKTGLGKSGAISADTINKSKGIFNQNNQLNNLQSGLLSVSALKEATNLRRSSFVGFSTGAGQSVVVSKEAIDKSRNAFDDTSFGKPSFSGFSTGLGNSVKISDEAVQRTQDFIDSSAKPTTAKKSNEDFTKNSNSFTKKINESQSGFGGFSTGAGQSVVVSKEAMEKSKNTFDDRSFEKPSFSGFSTGMGNTVKISAEALSQTKGVKNNSASRGTGKKSKEDFSETQRESDAFFAAARKSTEFEQISVNSTSSLPIPNFPEITNFPVDSDSDEGPPSPILTTSQCYQRKRKFDDISGISNLPHSPKRLKTENNININNNNINMEYECIRRLLTNPTLNPQFRPSYIDPIISHTDNPFDNQNTRVNVRHHPVCHLSMHTKLNPTTDSILHKCMVADKEVGDSIIPIHSTNFTIPFKVSNLVLLSSCVMI